MCNFTYWEAWGVLLGYAGVFAAGYGARAALAKFRRAS